jgi:NAD(P)-dependent dehydrogenase (short-subunit alcohol dehydrogenase family)
MACASTAWRRTPSSPSRSSGWRPRSGGGRWPRRSRWGGWGPRRTWPWPALFLASDSAAWLTGVTLDVAGGYVMT